MNKVIENLHYARLSALLHPHLTLTELADRQHFEARFALLSARAGAGGALLSLRSCRAPNKATESPSFRGEVERPERPPELPEALERGGIAAEIISLPFESLQGRLKQNPWL